MNDRPIGVFDSGIGGISVLNELIRLLPAEDYIFYADSINNPYGQKDKRQLEKIVDHIMDYFLKQNVKLVVVACNSATTQTINYLRKKYRDILFVGIEPAVKVAYDYYKRKTTLVMATPVTIQSDRMKYLINTYKQENRILLACPKLASIIEQGKLSELPMYFTTLYKEVPLDKVEVVVLGCTHYSLIKEQIKKAIGKDIILIDGTSAVAKRVKYLLIQNKIEAKKNKPGKISFYLTDKNTEKGILQYFNI